MKRVLVLAAVGLSAVLAVPPGIAVSAPYGMSGSSRTSAAVGVAEEEGDELGPVAPAEHRFVQKTYRGEGLPAHAYDIAAAEAAALPTTGGSWNLIGPSNIGGRVVDAVLDPNHRDTVFIATASGGLWRSADAGMTYAPAWPESLTQAMGAVAIAPDGTLYAGTGETNPGGGSLTYTGTGLYRSTDGGAGWTNVGLRDSGAIGHIAIDPRNPQRIFVAASGSLFNPGGERGVYRSDNGGASWTRVLAPANDTTGATEVMFTPGNPQRMYAIMWDHRRQPNHRQYSGLGSGLYRSDDGGSAWQRIDSLAPAAPGLGRIGLGIAPTDPNRLYAIVGRGLDSSNFFDGFYTSTDGGTTWTRLPDDDEMAENQSSYAWWFGKVWVDPNDADHVHVAGISLMTTHDGGQNWTAQLDPPHADQHVLLWDPRYPSRTYLGNDGGMYRSDADGDGSWVKAAYQPFNQFYSAAITPQDTSRVSGGTQDNGNLRSWGGPRFNEYVGGDGEENLINPTDVDNVFACFQYGNCFRSTDGGDTSEDISPLFVDRANWFSPVQFDPGDPNVMYFGANQLLRSTDNGQTWAAISPDLTGGPGQDAYPFGTITTVAAAPTDPRTIYFGTDDGRIAVTRDLGTTWTLAYTGTAWITRVTVDPANAGTVYVTRSGYRSGSYQPHVMVSRDYGASWTDLSGNLPQAPVNDVLLGRGHTLFVATDQGVFVSPSGNANWLRLGRGLPLVPVDDIEYDAGHHRLVAATFGRSIYELQVP